MGRFVNHSMVQFKRYNRKAPKGIPTIRRRRIFKGLLGFCEGVAVLAKFLAVFRGRFLIIRDSMAGIGSYFGLAPGRCAESRARGAERIYRESLRMRSLCDSRSVNIFDTSSLRRADDSRGNRRPAALRDLDCSHLSRHFSGR